MAGVSKFQNDLLNEVKAEGEKFGEDIKHLADFTSGVKKFEPWIATAEAKKAAGMKKPANLNEALEFLDDAKVRSESDILMTSPMTSPVFINACRSGKPRRRR